MFELMSSTRIPIIPFSSNLECFNNNCGGGVVHSYLITSTINNKKKKKGLENLRELHTEHFEYRDDITKSIERCGLIYDRARKARSTCVKN